MFLKEAAPAIADKEPARPFTCTFGAASEVTKSEIDLKRLSFKYGVSISSEDFVMPLKR